MFLIPKEWIRERQNYEGNNLATHPELQQLSFQNDKLKKNKFVAVLNLSISFLHDLSTSFFFFFYLDKDFYSHMQMTSNSRIIFENTVSSNCIHVLSKIEDLKYIIFTFKSSFQFLYITKERFTPECI